MKDSDGGVLQHEDEGYWFTEVDYHHPYQAPDPDSISIMLWFQPYGLRTFGRAFL